MNNISIAPSARIIANGCSMRFRYVKGGKQYRITLVDASGVDYAYRDTARSGKMTLTDAAARARAGTWGPTTEVHQALVELADISDELRDMKFARQVHRFDAEQELEALRREVAKLRAREEAREVADCVAADLAVEDSVARRVAATKAATESLR